jgi:uncharacterized protein (UPF0335 family)
VRLERVFLSVRWIVVSLARSTKGEGFDVKVLREILRLRKLDREEREERESLLDLHLRAMESAGASRAEAAQRQAGSELSIFKEARFHGISARHMTNSAAAKPFAELRPAALARCVANRDGDRFFLADQNHQALSAGDARVEKVTLQHRVVLCEDRDDHAGYSDPWLLWMVAA